jgi:hypothetical protein
MTSDLISKIKVTDATTGVELATQPGIELGEVTGTDTEKQFSVKVLTGILPYGEYNLQILEGIATNIENIANQPYTDVNGFEITDNTPPETPEISATPTEYTSGNVVVTIDYKNADVKLYSFTGNIGDWQTYTSALTISENNTTVYAMGKDNAENETGLVTKTIANIDKVAPQNAVFNLTVTDDTISGTITLADNESGISLANSKYLITTSSTALAINATEWNTATQSTANPQSISVTKENGDYYVQTLSTDNVGNKRVNVSGVITVSNILPVNAPILATGMTPIKWDASGNVVTTTSSDANWYDYGIKKWANAITTDGSMWVWIPRYEYKIPTPHSSTAQEIAVNFIQGISITPTIGYIMHPAFTFGTDELTGIWVAKFEASGTTSAVDIKPNVASLRSITIDAMFTASRNMETNSRYGWGTTGTGIDTHLIKNVEWGAVAYLSSSAYGKTGEIWINPNSNITGQAGTTVNAVSTTTTYSYNELTYGINASTTGNIYGIYDMNGGSYEYTAAYLDNGNSNLTTNGASLLNAENKYKDLYLKGVNDDFATNYNLTATKFGDAIWETSTNGGDVNSSSSWYTDNSNFTYTTKPFFLRGAYYTATNRSGIFAFNNYRGEPDSVMSFRPILINN